ncbi:MAG: hypothetical protein A3K09_02530 [Nitrospinae bacterium RIFCSPLOWO2_12_FULL_47_7]|nr:MAG: hypothetical protein A3K09_02530 [Nitrospinae bacterium RIFCSPLOWO2_12_FULL_47_7]
MQNTHLLTEEILRLYREPVIGGGYGNMYGEENIQNLVKKYRSLNPNDMQLMTELLVGYSKSNDLASSYVSVGALHALGMDSEVADAYEWAQNMEDANMFRRHFDIGKSIADHFIGH